MGWTPTRLEEDKEKDKRRILTISLNEDDEEWVEALKKVFDTDKDGEAIKNGAMVGLNVIHAHFRDNFRLVPFIKRERKKKKSPYLRGLP